MEQGLKKVLGLACGFALLGAETFKAVDDAGKFLLKRERRQIDFNFFKLSCIQDAHSPAVRQSF